MKIFSSAFKNNEAIPKKYACDGDNVNPPFEISDAPKGAKSLVLIVDDPDAPAGLWTHWTVWNIDPGTKAIRENSVPEKAAEGVTSFGKSGYGGPCPPSGTHRYFFKLYALDAALDLGGKNDVANLKKAMDGHIMDRAEIIGFYAR